MKIGALYNITYHMVHDKSLNKESVNHYQRLEALVSRETSFYRKMDNKQKIE